MAKIPSSIDPKSLTVQELSELSAAECDNFIERMDKEVFDDEVRR